MPIKFANMVVLPASATRVPSTLLLHEPARNVLTLLSETSGPWPRPTALALFGTTRTATGTSGLGFALATFLGINGCEIDTTDADVVTTMVASADGTVSETQLAAWIRKHLRRVK